MNQIDFSTLAKLSVQNCEPLYLSHPFLKDGHNSSKANATILYVTYRGNLYGITCAHVYDQQFGESGATEKVLTVFGDRLIYQFGNWTADGYQSHFKLLRNNCNTSTSLDIAIINLPAHFQELHMTRKGKLPIDLDHWEEPDWSSILSCVVSGFPTEHKEQSDSHVAANLVQIVAELTRPIDPGGHAFMLASTLPEKNDYFFSGVSGGPVYCIKSDNTLTLVGVVFEGSPGSSAEWEKRGDDAFMSQEDVQFRAYLLTPRVFADWISRVGFV
jgi:hypothetical protein